MNFTFLTELIKLDVKSLVLIAIILVILSYLGSLVFIYKTKIWEKIFNIKKVFKNTSTSDNDYSNVEQYYLKGTHEYVLSSLRLGVDENLAGDIINRLKLLSKERIAEKLFTINLLKVEKINSLGINNLLSILKKNLEMKSVELHFKLKDNKNLIKLERDLDKTFRILKLNNSEDADHLIKII